MAEHCRLCGLETGFHCSCSERLTSSRSRYRPIRSAEALCSGSQWAGFSPLPSHRERETSYLRNRFVCLFVLETGSCFVVQAILELVILLPQTSEVFVTTLSLLGSLPIRPLIPFMKALLSRLINYPLRFTSIYHYLGR